MYELIGLDQLMPGDTAAVCRLENEPTMRCRLQDLGLIEETEVECVGVSPGGELSAYLIRGAVIAIRADDAKRILVLRRRCEGASRWD